MRRGIFLDRDGTLIEEREYLSRPEEVALIPQAGEALARAQRAGFLLILVTNQSGVGRGYFSLEDMERVHAHLADELRPFGVRLDRIYAAPEAPDQPSRGRKPSPQFLFDARDELGIKLADSYMIGDKAIDLQCGWNAGVKKSLLVRTGYGAKTERELGATGLRSEVVDDLAGAVDWIIKQ